MRHGTPAPNARDNGKMPHPHPDSFIRLNYATGVSKRERTGLLKVCVITDSFPRAIHELLAQLQDNVKVYHTNSRMLATESAEYWFFDEPTRMQGHEFNAWGIYSTGKDKSGAWWTAMEDMAKSRTR